jgi:uncharacterized protein YjbJ (UPF0337 family)
MSVAIHLAALRESSFRTPGTAREHDWNVGTTRAFRILSLNGEWKMDREHVKGTADKAKGAIKETAGKVTGDTKMQAVGKLDKAKGAARKVVGDVKDAARDATDND